jgi:hypothetical protein
MSQAPIYEMPSAYQSIKRNFPSTFAEPETTSVRSMVVEIDESREPFDLFEDKPAVAKARSTRRHTLLASGNIAAKQRLRKKRRSKPPKEISANILRTTGSIVGKTVTGTVKTVSGTVHKAKDAFDIVKGSTGRLVKKFRLKGEEKEKGDELHKYIYDMHLPDSEDTRSDDTFTGVEPVVTGRGRSRRLGRRQTWTNLGSMLDLNEGEVTVGDGGVDVKDIKLGTIEEVAEMSHYSRNRSEKLCDTDWKGNHHRSTNNSSEQSQVIATSLQRMANYLHEMRISPKCDIPLEDGHPTAENPLQVQAMDEIGRSSLQKEPPNSPQVDASHQSPIPSDPLLTPQTVIHNPSHSRVIAPSRDYWETFPSSPAPTPPPSKPLRPLSNSAQELFDATNNSTTYYSTVSDPIKPSTSSHLTLQPEITRSSSCFDGHPVRYDHEIGGGEESWCTDILPEQEPLQRRHVSSLYSRATSLNPVQSSASSERKILSDLADRQTTSHDRDMKELSIPALESWKWAPPPVEKGKIDENGEGTRSVRDRVRELDMAIDTAFSMEGRGPAVTRKRSLFGRWKAN